MTRKRWIAGAIILIGGASLYWYFFMRSTTPVASATTTITVGTGSIRTTVKSTGKISPIQSSSLTFKKQGTLTHLYKKIGDSVKKGELIAEVDAESVHLDISNAELSLSNARNNYDKLFSNITDSDKIRSKNTLTESETQLETLEAQYDNLLISQENTKNDSESTIKLLTDKLALSKSDLEYTKQNIKTDTTSNNLEKDLANGFQTLEDIGRTIPDIIKASKDYSMIEDKSNPRYGDLSNRDITIKAQAESLYISTVKEISDFTTKLSTLRNKTDRTFDVTLALLEDGKKVLTDLSTLSTLIFSEYDNSIESNNLTADYITSTKTILRGYGSTLGSKLTSINSTIATLKSYGNDDLKALADKNTLATKEQAVLAASNDLTKAKASYEALKKSQITDRNAKSQDIEKQKNLIILNKASYEELMKGPTSTDLTSAINNISQSEVSLEKARLNLNDYQIIATFDGIITDIPWKVGDTTVGDSTTGTSNQGILVENKNAYEISLSLDQIDIVKVKVGMPAKIVLDAFPTETYTGVVNSISAVPSETSGVVSYIAKTNLSIPRTDIYSKMSTTVEIITAERSNVIVINSSATTSSGGKIYVQVAGTGQKGEKREIVTGVSDAGKVEVLSGLTLGEKLIIRSGTGTISKSSAPSSKSSTRGFGGPPPGF